jgi:hypothetical protein
MIKESRVPLLPATVEAGFQIHKQLGRVHPKETIYVRNGEDVDRVADK